jgi:hypothetical protein
LALAFNPFNGYIQIIKTNLKPTGTAKKRHGTGNKGGETPVKQLSNIGERQ